MMGEGGLNKRTYGAEVKLESIRSTEEGKSKLKEYFNHPLLRDNREIYPGCQSTGKASSERK